MSDEFQSSVCLIPEIMSFVAGNTWINSLYAESEPNGAALYLQCHRKDSRYYLKNGRQGID